MKKNGIIQSIVGGTKVDRIMVEIGIAALAIGLVTSVVSHTKGTDSKPSSNPTAAVRANESTESVKDEEPEVKETTPTVEYKIEDWEDRLQDSAAYNVIPDPLTVDKASLEFNGHTETYYSSNDEEHDTTATVVPGKHTADDGTYRDTDGYIVVAMPENADWIAMGDKIMTSLGPGKVYDSIALESEGQNIAIYTNW